MNFRMGKPTFDLCYSEDEFFHAQVVGSVMRRCFRTAEDVLGLTEINMKVFMTEYIGHKSEPGELKHLSTRRKGHQRDSVSSGERTRTRPMLLFF